MHLSIGSPCLSNTVSLHYLNLPPIRYSDTQSQDPVAILQRKLASGQLVLDRDKQHGVLPSLLKQLDVPVEFQVLVFSKTSLQIHKISPTNPRALYFSDSVYVGYVPGSSILELAANDPALGAVFYTLEVDPKTDGSELVRDPGQWLAPQELIF